MDIQNRNEKVVNNLEFMDFQYETVLTNDQIDSYNIIIFYL